ncbi:MAG: hypothetical protein HY794_05210, partial [Desulfarculus sp.]|nr:hypothetical protein [Desulfarculus sp.]
MRMKSLAMFTVMLLVLGAGAALADQGPQAQGPGMVPAGKWQVGLASTWLSSERFQDTTEFSSENGTPGSEPSTNLKIRNDRLHLATVSYGLHRRLTLTARAGMAEGGLIAETLSNGLWEAKLKPVFVWGLG